MQVESNVRLRDASPRANADVAELFPPESIKPHSLKAPEQ
jgi:hypothetical protein